VIKFVVKTNKGYCGGRENKTYKMEDKSVDGWHTYSGYKYEKIKWVEDKEECKEFWINTLNTFLDKLEFLINKDLEDVEYINIEVKK